MPPAPQVNWEEIQTAMGKLLALELSMTQHSRALSEKARLSSANRERRQEMALVSESYRMAVGMIAEARVAVERSALSGGVNLVHGRFVGSQRTDDVAGAALEAAAPATGRRMTEPILTAHVYESEYALDPTHVNDDGTDDH